MSTATAEQASDAPPRRGVTSTGIPTGRVIVIFLGLILGILMSALDQTIVSTALPHIAADLHGFQQITWIVTTYLLAQTIVMPIYGKVGDFIGRKPAFQIAVVIFLVGSIIAGLSQSMGMLIAMRAVQGVGAGGLMIGAQTIMAEVVSARERGKYMSVMGPMIGVATVLGPLLGGFLTTSVSWRWIFYINVPFGLAAMLVTGLALKLPKQRHTPRVDYWGALFAGGTAACLVLFLTWGGRTYAWDSPTILGLIVGSVLLAALFVLAEHRATEPIMPLRLFRDNVFRTNSLLALLIGLSLFGAVSYLPTFLQISLGASATMSGLLMLPLMGGMMFSAIITGQLISRIGRYKVFPILGAAIGTVGMYLISLMDADTSRGTSSIYMVVLGLGIGLIMPTLVLTVQNSVAQRDMGAATAGVNFFRQIGGSIGTAIIGSLFVGRLADNLAEHLPTAFAHKLGDQAEGVTTAVLERFPARIAHEYVVSYADALTPLYAYLAPAIFIGFVLAWFLKEKPLATTLSRGKLAEQRAAQQTENPQTETPQAEHQHAETVAPGTEQPSLNGTHPATNGSAPPAGRNGAAPQTEPGRSSASETAVPARLAGGGGPPMHAPPVARTLNVLQARSAGDGAGHAANDPEAGLSGSVYRAGDAAASVPVNLLDLHGRRVERTRTGPDGSYRLALPGPGTYLLVAQPVRAGVTPVAELVTAAGEPVFRDLRLATG